MPNASRHFADRLELRALAIVPVKCFLTVSTFIVAKALGGLPPTEGGDGAPTFLEMPNKNAQPKKSNRLHGLAYMRNRNALTILGSYLSRGFRPVVARPTRWR